MSARKPILSQRILKTKYAEKPKFLQKSLNQPSSKKQNILTYTNLPKKTVSKLKDQIHFLTLEETKNPNNASDLYIEAMENINKFKDNISNQNRQVVFNNYCLNKIKKDQNSNHINLPQQGKINNTNLTDDNIRTIDNNIRININNDENMDIEDKKLLYALKMMDLENCFSKFNKNMITFNDIILLSKEDLIEMNFPIGPRNRLLHFANEYRKFAKTYDYNELVNFFNVHKELHIKNLKNANSIKNKLTKNNVQCESTNNNINFGTNLVDDVNNMQKNTIDSPNIDTNNQRLNDIDKRKINDCCTYRNNSVSSNYNVKCNSKLYKNMNKVNTLNCNRNNNNNFLNRESTSKNKIGNHNVLSNTYDENDISINPNKIKLLQNNYMTNRSNVLNYKLFNQSYKNVSKLVKPSYNIQNKYSLNKSSNTNANTNLNNLTQVNNTLNNELLNNYKNLFSEVESFQQNYENMKVKTNERINKINNLLQINPEKKDHQFFEYIKNCYKNNNSCTNRGSINKSSNNKYYKNLIYGNNNYLVNENERNLQDELIKIHENNDINKYDFFPNRIQEMNNDKIYYK